MGKKKNIEYDFEIAKKEYREFCEGGNNDIQIFAQPWYLDAVCNSPDDWKVIIYKENNKIIAAFPFEYEKGKWGLWHIKNPWQAPRLGIWINYEGKDNKNSTKEAYESKVCNYIIDNLPKFDIFKISFDSRFTNWQPFYNKKFQQTINYSYIYEIDELNEIIKMSNINKIKKRYIKAFPVENIHQLEDFEKYWSFIAEISYKERNRMLSYKKDAMERLHKAVMCNRAGRIYYYLEDDRIIGINYYFFDSRRSYKMFGTFINTDKGTAQAALTHHASIEFLMGGITFDFEGSMIKGVADFNRGMGAKKEPYFVISKHSPKYIFFESFRTMIRSLKGIIKGE